MICLDWPNVKKNSHRGHFTIAMFDWLMKQARGTSESTEVEWKIGIIYNIGCNLEKGIKKVSCPTTFSFISSCQETKMIKSIQHNIFKDAQAANCLMFATGVWHSYAHQHFCQIKYNPRWNPDWGMSDREGMERIWSSLAALIAPLRYSTKEHWLWALHFQSIFHNKAVRATGGM